jgi:uncharacterized protein
MQLRMTRAFDTVSLMRKFMLLVPCLVMLVVLVRAEQPTAATSQPASAPTSLPGSMEKHTLVLLVLSDNPPKLDKDAAAALQKKHLAHIEAMSRTGKVLVAGPFADRDDERLRGQLIFNCGIDEARAMASEDPAVVAGRLKVVCMSWVTEKGSLAFPRSSR